MFPLTSCFLSFLLERQESRSKSCPVSATRVRPWTFPCNSHTWDFFCWFQNVGVLLFVSFGTPKIIH